MTGGISNLWLVMWIRARGRLFCTVSVRPPVITVLLTSVVLSVLPKTHAQDDAVQHFEKHVRPVLIRNCISCHGLKKQESGLRLDSRAGALAGRGIKGGHVHGATDETGWKAVEKPVHVYDIHATMLHLLGFDHQAFTYRYAGRDFRLTDVHGRVVDELLA
jgi:hypothetical protein